MEGDVGVRADPVRGGVLPGLEPRSMQQVVQLCGTEGAACTSTRHACKCVCCTHWLPVVKGLVAVGNVGVEGADQADGQQREEDDRPPPQTSLLHA